MRPVNQAVALATGMAVLLVAHSPSARADECCVFAEAFGADANEVALCTIVASDGSLVMTGYTDGGLSGKNVFFAKFDSDGGVLRKYVYGGGSDEEGRCVVETQYGDFIVVGYTKSRGDGANVLVSKFNSSGVHQWTKTWGEGHGYNEEFYSVIRASDDTLWAAGYTASYTPAGDKKVLLAKINSSGTTLTCSRAGKLTDNWDISGYAVAEVFGAYPGFCVAGTVIDDDLILGFGQEILLAKFSDTPGFWWAKRFGVEERSDEAATSIVRTSDACLALAGWIYHEDGPYWSHSGFLLKTDADAELDWARRASGLGPYYSRKLTTVIETDDGNLAVTGYDHGGVMYDDRVALAKLSLGGALLWSKGHEAGSECVNNSLAEDSNGCLVASGSTEGYGQGGSDALLIRYLPSGSTCLPEFEGPGFSSWSASEHDIELTGAQFTASTSNWSVQFSTYGILMDVTPICSAMCPTPGSSGNYCTADVAPNNGDGIWDCHDGDCIVDLADLAELLAHFGCAAGCTREDGDIEPLGGDGAVDLADLAMLLSQFGDDCN